MMVDDSLCRGQAYAEAGKLACRMQPLEWDEQPVRIFHLETRAIVLDAINSFPFALRNTELDSRDRPLRAEFPRVADEVVYYHLEQHRISFRIDIFGNR